MRGSESLTAAALVHLLRCVLDTRGMSGAEGPVTRRGHCPQWDQCCGGGGGTEAAPQPLLTSRAGRAGSAEEAKPVLDPQGDMTGLGPEEGGRVPGKGIQGRWEIPEPWEKFHLTGQPG